MANGELDRCVRAEHPAMDCFGIPAKQCTIGVSDGHIVEPPVFSARDVAFRNGSGQDMNKHFVHFPTCHRAAKVLQCGRMLSVQIDARIICKHQFMHGFHAHLVTDSSRAAPGDSFAKSADISSCKQTDGISIPGLHLVQLLCPQQMYTWIECRPANRKLACDGTQKLSRKLSCDLHIAACNDFMMPVQTPCRLLISI